MQRRRRFVWQLLQWSQLSWSVPKEGATWPRFVCYCYTVLALIVSFWLPLVFDQMPKGLLQNCAVGSGLLLAFWCIAGLPFQSVSAFNPGPTGDPKLDFEAIFYLSPPAVIFKGLGQLAKLPFHWLAGKWWERIHPFAEQRRRIRQELDDHLALVGDERREALKAEAQRLLRQSDEMAVQLLERSAAKEHERVTAQHDQVLTEALGEVAGELTEAQQRLREVDVSLGELDAELAGE